MIEFPSPSPDPQPPPRDSVSAKGPGAHPTAKSTCECEPACLSELHTIFHSDRQLCELWAGWEREPEGPAGNSLSSVPGMLRWKCPGGGVRVTVTSPSVTEIDHCVFHYVKPPVSLIRFCWSYGSQRINVNQKRELALLPRGWRLSGNGLKDG